MMQATFFVNQSPTDKKTSEIHYNKAYQTTVLFEVIAQHLIGSLKSQPIDLIKKLGKVLKEHAKYYPNQLPVYIKKLKMKDQFAYLLYYSQPLNKVLLPSLAYTLQQMTVDVIAQYPEQYGNLLLKGQKLAELRIDKKLDDPSVLQALADKVLKLNIFVERYHDTSQLPVKEFYLSCEQNSKNLYIHYQDNAYQSNLLRGVTVL